MSLPVEFGLNGVHVEKGTPKLDDLFIVGRGDQFKLVLGLAFEQSENGFPVLNTDVWAVDTSIAVDMVCVFALMAGSQRYPDSLGYSQHFDEIMRVWRPARR
ncbi:MAG: hypothetical protein ACLP59_05700 [Bryobacteraceae bacterium]